MNLKVLYTDPLFDFFRTKDNSLPAQNESFSEGTFIDNFRFHFNFYNKRANTYWLSSLYAAVQSVYHLTSPEGQDAPVFPDITTGDLPTCLFFLSRVSLHFPNHVFSASPIDILVSIHFVLKIRRPLSLPRPVSSRVSHLSVFFIVHDFVIALYLRPGYNRANKCECRHFR